MDPVLFIVAPLGVLGVIGLTWLFGGLRDASLASPEIARQRLAELDPGFVAAGVTLARSGAGAIFSGAGDHKPRIAVLVPLGDRFVSRVLGPGDVVDAAVVGERLVIRTRDFTGPRLALALGAGEAERWRERLLEFNGGAVDPGGPDG
ncbi:MAG: hypothetical protein H6711_31295 [Myxococcales bacterium]|nr:hypothetical protein [Myxococcales bacterium]